MMGISARSSRPLLGLEGIRRGRDATGGKPPIKGLPWACLEGGVSGGAAPVVRRKRSAVPRCWGGARSLAGKPGPPKAARACRDHCIIQQYHSLSGRAAKKQQTALPFFIVPPEEPV